MSISTNINDNGRKRKPRITYTPTQRPSATLPDYYLLFFYETESYQIVARSSIKRNDDQGTATVVLHNKLCQGKIILAGTLEDCERELGRITRLSQQDNNNHDMNLEEVSGGQRRITTQSHFGTASSITFHQPLSPDHEDVENQNDNLDDDMLESYLNSTKNTNTNKRKNVSGETNKKRKRMDKKTDNYPQTDQLDLQSEEDSCDFSVLNMLEKNFNMLDNKLIFIENKNDQKMSLLTKKIDYLMASSSTTNKTLLDSYRDETNEQFQKELMHNNINLLSTLASSVGDFARKTMRIVFSEEELKTCVLPPKRSFLARPSLDEKKFQLVNDAVRIRFKLDLAKYAAFYKNVLRRKMTDFLIEERRRESNKNARHYLRALRTHTTDNSFSSNQRSC